MARKKDKGKKSKKAETQIVEPKPEPKAEEVEVVHSDFANMAPEAAVASDPAPKPEPKAEKPKPKPAPKGDQAVATGHFGGTRALCVLSKTPTGYEAQIIRSAPSGPVTSPPAPFKDLDAGLTWARAVMSVQSVRMQAQVPVADVAKELA